MKNTRQEEAEVINLPPHLCCSPRDQTLVHFVVRLPVPEEPGGRDL